MKRKKEQNAKNEHQRAKKRDDRRRADEKIQITNWQQMQQNWGEEEPSTLRYGTLELGEEE